MSEIVISHAIELATQIGTLVMCERFGKVAFRTQYIGERNFEHAIIDVVQNPVVENAYSTIEKPEAFIEFGELFIMHRRAHIVFEKRIGANRHFVRLGSCSVIASLP